MVIAVILLSIAFIGLLIGTCTDFKTREVPDWINYSMIFTGLGLRGIYSAFTFDWMFLVYGLFGLGVFTAIAYAMFYTGQWGGGDAKMIMGLGALIGLPFVFKPIPLSFVFLANLIIFGAIYGIIWMVTLIIIHRKKFWLDFYKRIRAKEMMKTRKIVLFSVIGVLILNFIFVRPVVLTISVFLFAGFAYVMFYIYLAAKSMEAVAMHKYIIPEKLTEGDWIAKEIKINGKLIAGPKDLGISKKQIKKLIALKKKGKIRKVLVKYGIPFVPSFLIAFIVTILFGAWWMFLV